MLRHRVIREVMLVITNLAAAVVPADRRLVVCGAQNGRWYGDNSRQMFEWLSEHRPGMRVIWVTRSRNVHRSLSALGMPVVLAQTPLGWWCVVRARIGLYTNSLRDLALAPWLIPNRLQLVALRHGRSVKRVRFARIGHRLDAAEIAERQREGALVRYVISTSEFVSDIQEICLKVGRSRHVVTGYPRNDQIVSPGDAQQQAWCSFLNGDAPRRVLLYAPSWRHGREATRFLPFDDLDFDTLARWLEGAGTMLLLRPHMNDLHRFPEQREFLERLVALSPSIRLAAHDAFPDVNTVLPFVDVLISDYSALYHDFLLLDRPLIFVPYDFESFSQRNGFLYDYFEALPGPSVQSQEAFIEACEIATSGADGFEVPRRALRDRIHTHRDDQSCRRVADLVDALIH